MNKRKSPAPTVGVMARLTPADRRAIMLAGVAVGLPPDVPINIIAACPDLDPQDIEAACELFGYTPAAPQFIANLIASGVLFDLSDVPLAVDEDEDKYAGTTTSEALSGLE